MSKKKQGVSRPGAGSFLLFVADGSLSFLGERGTFRAPARVTFLCLRRVTFFPWRKKVTKERHLRKGGFRFPPFLKNPIPLKRPKREGCGPPSLETPTCVWAIIKSRLCRKAAKVGGGRGPPFERRPCHETKNHTALHCRAKAAAKRGAETVQHLGEIFAAQRSRGKSIRDKNHVKARKEIQKRSFWRRFWVLLPLMAKVPRRRQKKTDCHGRGAPSQ